MSVVGIDGCKIGWIYVQFDGKEFSSGVAPTVEEILSNTPEVKSIFIDIPIGLRDDSGDPRKCDTEARKQLGRGRASSVFPAPIREILHESTYAEAHEKSQDLIGKGISKQSFAITPKIREVDTLLASNTLARDLIREVHPELCFWAFNSQQAMKFRKTTPEGFDERMAVLRHVLPESKEIASDLIARYLRKDVARDDIADALVALATAMQPADALRTLPSEPEKDSRGLPMEMVYCC